MPNLIRREPREDAPAFAPPARQPYLFPADLFTREAPGPTRFWTCVRTRPRWEKKLTRWLLRSGMTHYLPVVPNPTVSGRKRRISEIPLFPGFVFVEGDHDKGDFDRLGNVVFVLKPRIPRQADQLHHELWNIWTGLSSGLYVSPVQNLAAGEPCRITRGPLQGAQARFERAGRNGRLILQVELMGSGLAVEVPPDAIELID